MAEEKKTSLSTITREENGNIVLHITIPKADVEKAWKEEVDQTVKNAALPGFRKGKAPADVVEKQLNKEKITEDTLRKLLPGSYTSAVKQHSVKPLINPKIHVEKITESEDWAFTATVCEMPEVALNDYKKAISDINAKSKIAVTKDEQPKEPNFEEIAKTLLDTITVSVAPVLSEGESERLMMQLFQEIQSLGMTIEQYLQSAKKTLDQLKKEYKEKAEKDIKLEFILQKIADEEKISIEPQELQEAMSQAKTPEEKQQLQANMYMLANILRQQKTLDFIKNL